MAPLGGGLMQLIAYGLQDVYLTGNPQITFWKSTYRRHTNFSCVNEEEFEPSEPIDNKSINKNHMTELLKLGLHETIYLDNKIKIIKIIFEQETCDICMELPQCIKTTCGHKYCHSCFTMRHIEEKHVCSFCNQNIGDTIYLFDEDLNNETDDDSDDDSEIKNILYEHYLNKDQDEDDNNYNEIENDINDEDFVNF